jgi:hypothetical protein
MDGAKASGKPAPIGERKAGQRPLDPEQYRHLFPILRTKVHLANCSQAPLSIPVRDALAAYEASLLETGRDWETWMGEVSHAKAAFAALIGATSDDVAVLSSVSDAVSAVASCLPNTGAAAHSQHG